MSPDVSATLNWILAHSWQAGALVVLVLLAQWVFRRQLTNRWRFALWWIVLLRLLVPFSPESAVSIFNFLHPTVQIPATIQPAAPPADEHRNQYPPTEAALRETISDSPEKFRRATTPVPASFAAPVHPFEWRQWIIPGLATLWVTGVVILIGAVAIQLLRFQRKLARAAQPAEAALRNLLEECRNEFHVTRTIELLETDAVQSPALFGLFRLRLLLPIGMGGHFGRAELRYIFLHELAHVKRGDLWLNWLVTGLLILHWFNPLLWLGFARLRADRELACDELALLRAGDQAGTAYGETVVKLLEYLIRPTAIPGLVGILEDAGQMRRRIAMIANFRRPGRWSVLAGILLAALAAAALTDAQSNKPESPSVSADAPADRSVHGRIIDTAGHPIVGALVEVKGVRTGSAAARFIPDPVADPKTVTDENGEFLITDQRRFETICFKVSAPKYAPRFFTSPPAIASHNFTLTEGARLKGRVVFDGHPTAGMVLGLDVPQAVPDFEFFDVFKTTTDARGNFEFANIPPWSLCMPFSVFGSTNQPGVQQQLMFSTERDGEITDAGDLAEKPAHRVAGRVVLTDGQPLPEGSRLIFRDSCNWDTFEIALGPDGIFAAEGLGSDYSRSVHVPGYHISPRNLHLDSTKVWQFSGPEHNDITNLTSLMEPGGDPLPVSNVVPDYPGILQGPLRGPAMQPEATWGIRSRNNPEPVPGVKLTGVILRPNGEPATDAQVGLQGTGNFPHIGRGVLVGWASDWEHVLVNAKTDGSFTLPMYEGAQGVVAVNAEGCARVTLDQLKRTPQLRLQPWGRIQGTLTIGGRPRAGEFIAADPPAEWQAGLDPWNYNTERFETKTDAKGKFEIAFVPAGDFTLRWQISLRENAWGFRRLAVVAVKPGTTVVTNVGSTLRAVTGRLKFEGGTPPDVTNANFTVRTATLKYLKDYATLKTDADWQALIQSKENANTPLGHLYAVSLQADGSFQTEGLEPGEYELTCDGRTRQPAGPDQPVKMYVSLQDPIIQVNGNRHGNTVIDWGEIPMKKVVLPGRTNSTVTAQCDSATSPGSANGSPQINPTALAALTGNVLNPGGTLAVPRDQSSLPPYDSPLARAAETPANGDASVKVKSSTAAMLRGTVFNPDGSVATNAEVALSHRDDSPWVGHGEFVGYTEPEAVDTDTRGNFKLPNYDDAESIIALNKAGYAQVSLEQLDQSTEIHLQPWGRIEGVLHLGHHLGTNESVELRAPHTFLLVHIPHVMEPPWDDRRSFRARTDAAGHFIFNFVPPGDQILSRLVTGVLPDSDLALIHVTAGETVVTNVGDAGRIVTGKLTFSGRAVPPLTNVMLSVLAPRLDAEKHLRELKTDEERLAFSQTEEFQTLLKNVINVPATVGPDGAFRAEEVPPGPYELSFQVEYGKWSPTNKAYRLDDFKSMARFTVNPAASGDDSVVNVGTMEMEPFACPFADMIRGKPIK